MRVICMVTFGYVGMWYSARTFYCDVMHTVIG